MNYETNSEFCTTRLHVLSTFTVILSIISPCMDSEESSSKATDKAKERTLEQNEKVKGTYSNSAVLLFTTLSWMLVWSVNIWKTFQEK